ncbi:FMRFamide receptor-like isoform X1 [Scylla paramamosain]|uniref:FMRFamide receptor-like isoform X1 n=1 Tax=Scylla paramamosain TaxID=85552 RepID=UPI003083A3D3
MYNASTEPPFPAAVLTSLAPHASSTLAPLLESAAPSLGNLTDDGPEEVHEYAPFLAVSRFVVQLVLVPLVLVVGVLGNSVTIIVLTRRQMRSSTNFYLTALAISDLLYLVFIFSLSIRHHPGMNQPHHWFYWHYFRYALWLADASSSTSIWLTVTFTIERYIAVCHPIKGKVICTESRALRVIVAVFVLCFTLTATTPHEWVILVNTDPDSGQSRLTLAYSTLGSNTTYKKIFYWFTAVMFILLPLVLLAVFNSFLIHIVKQSRATRRTMTNTASDRDSHSQSQENKITVMLIAVVLLALLCQLPVAVLLLYQSFYESKPSSTSYYIELGLGNIFNLLTAINAACNFVLYCAMSDKYRRTFLRTFCSRWYRHPSPLHSWMATAYSNVEDGSPRFSRVSSMRMSRRSSHRSSGSGSPRGSPTQGRFVGGSVRQGHYLTVPAHPAHAAHDDPAQAFLRKAPPGLVASHHGNNGVAPRPASPPSPVHMSPAASAAALLNGQPGSSRSEAATGASPRRGPRSLAHRLAALLPISRAPRTQLAGRHIVITCQQPSLDDQTAL